MPYDTNTVESDGTVAFENFITNHLIHAEVNPPEGEKIQGAKVIGRTKDPYGDNFGKCNDNPLFNSMLYDIEIPDGEIKEHSSNIIAEKMYVQADDEGYVQNTMEAILDYKRDASAVDKEDMYIKNNYGQLRIQTTTLGRKLLVQRKNRT